MKRPDGTFVIGKPRVVFAEDASLPINLCHVTLHITGPIARVLLESMPELAQYASVRPDKDAIRALILNGQPVDGCELEYR